MDYEKSIEIDLNKSICELRQMALDNGVDIEEVVADIWEHYIQMYLGR